VVAAKVSRHPGEVQEHAEEAVKEDAYCHLDSAGIHTDSLVQMFTKGLDEVSTGGQYMNTSTDSLSRAGRDTQGHNSIFCYSFVTWPLECTTESFVSLLTKACDDWQLFSHEEYPEFRVVKLYDQGEDGSDKVSMAYMTLLALDFMEAHRIRDRFGWLVRLEPDTFIRPSNFRAALSRYSVDFDEILSANNDGPEGYFIAFRSSTAQRLFRDARRSQCFEILDGSLLQTGMKTHKYAMHNQIDCNLFIEKSVKGFWVDSKYTFLADLGLKDFVAEQAVFALENLSGLRRLCPRSCDGCHAPCVRRDFALVHPVKTDEEYKLFMQAFP